MNTLLAATLNDNLAEIVGKLQSLMDSFWIYIVMALAAVVVVWGAFVGIKIAIAHKNEEKIVCLLYTSPSPRDAVGSRMPSSA